MQGIHHAMETGEFDIVEAQGNAHTYYGTIHDWVSGRDVASNSAHNTVTLASSVDVTRFHTYGLRWTPGAVTWYFADAPVKTAATYAIMDSQDYFVILGSQQGVGWTYGSLTGITASTLAVGVDQVRVWQP